MWIVTGHFDHAVEAVEHRLLLPSTFYSVGRGDKFKTAAAVDLQPDFSGLLEQHAKGRPAADASAKRISLISSDGKSKWSRNEFDLLVGEVPSEEKILQRCSATPNSERIADEELLSGCLTLPPSRSTISLRSRKLNDAISTHSRIFARKADGLDFELDARSFAPLLDTNLVSPPDAPTLHLLNRRDGLARLDDGLALLGIDKFELSRRQTWGSHKLFIHESASIPINQTVQIRSGDILRRKDRLFLFRWEPLVFGLAPAEERKRTGELYDARLKALLEMRPKLLELGMRLLPGPAHVDEAKFRGCSSLLSLTHHVTTRVRHDQLAPTMKRAAYLSIPCVVPAYVEACQQIAVRLGQQPNISFEGWPNLMSQPPPEVLQSDAAGAREHDAASAVKDYLPSQWDAGAIGAYLLIDPVQRSSAVTRRLRNLFQCPNAGRLQGMTVFYASTTADELDALADADLTALRAMGATVFWHQFPPDVAVREIRRRLLTCVEHARDDYRAHVTAAAHLPTTVAGVRKPWIPKQDGLLVVLDPNMSHSDAQLFLQTVESSGDFCCLSEAADKTHRLPVFLYQIGLVQVDQPFGQPASELLVRLDVEDVPVDAPQLAVAAAAPKRNASTAFQAEQQPQQEPVAEAPATIEPVAAPASVSAGRRRPLRARSRAGSETPSIAGEAGAAPPTSSGAAPEPAAGAGAAPAEPPRKRKRIGALAAIRESESKDQLLPSSTAAAEGITSRAVGPPAAARLDPVSPPAAVRRRRPLSESSRTASAASATLPSSSARAVAEDMEPKSRRFRMQLEAEPRGETMPLHLGPEEEERGEAPTETPRTSSVGRVERLPQPKNTPGRTLVLGIEQSQSLGDKDPAEVDATNQRDEESFSIAMETARREAFKAHDTFDREMTTGVVAPTLTAGARSRALRQTSLNSRGRPQRQDEEEEERDPIDIDLDAWKALDPSRVDIHVRGNYLQITQIPLVHRGSRGTTQQTRPSDDTPNYKVFNAKKSSPSSSSHRRIVRLQSPEANDYGLGSAYHGRAEAADDFDMEDGESGTQRTADGGSATALSGRRRNRAMLEDSDSDAEDAPLLPQPPQQQSHETSGRSLETDRPADKRSRLAAILDDDDDDDNLDDFRPTAAASTSKATKARQTKASAPAAARASATASDKASNANESGGRQESSTSSAKRAAPRRGAHPSASIVIDDSDDDGDAFRFSSRAKASSRSNRARAGR